MPRDSLIKLRRGTAAAWTSANPTLDPGEPGYETDTKKWKVGDGSTAWVSLGYAGSGAVASVFTRTGAVVAASGDYNAGQVTNSPAGGISATDVQAALNELDTEKATQAYVDAAVQGLSIKSSCRLATAAALPAVTLVGSTLVAVSVGVLTIDGQAVALGDRILVKDQVAQTQNGIYTCTTAGAALVAFVLTRATDSDTSAEIVGAFTFVEEGTANAASGFVNTNSGTITVGTTAITYTQFSGAGEITAGDGMAKSGNTLSVNVDGATLEISSDALRVKALGITDSQVAAANKDGTVSTPSLRTLGTGAQQALPGNTSIPSVPSFATNAVVLGSAAAAGVASTVIRSDDTIAAFDATAPSTQAFSDAAAVGTAAFAARRDHKHAWPKNYAQLHLLQSPVTNCLAEVFPRWAINSNTALLSSARLSSSAIGVYSGMVLTNVSWMAGNTAPSGLSNWWFALTDSSFNVIRQSIDKLATAWTGASTHQTLAVDSIPVTAGARVASSTVTLTFPTLSQALTALVAVGDSIVVSNANIAAYNGTFTVVTVSSTQVTYVSGGSATDSLVAPFPTVQLAAGKRTYTVPADGLVYAVIMVKGTVGTLGCFAGISAGEVGALAPIVASSGNTGLTGTCPSPITTATTGNIFGWAAVS